MRKWLAISLVLLVAAGCRADSEIWNGYGGNGSRSLSSKERGPNKPRLTWVAEIEGIEPGCPVVANGSIYIPHSGGSITKVNSRGDILWRFDSWVSGSEVLPPHLLLVGGNKLLLSTQGAREQTFLLSTDGETIVGSDPLPWPASMSPAAADTGYTVVCHQYLNDAGAVALRVYGIIKGDEALWKRDYCSETQSYFGSNPVVLEDGRSWVFVESDQGNNKLVCFGTAGEILWHLEFFREETMGVGAAIAAAQDGTIYFGTPRIEDIRKVHSPGWLYAVGADGNVLWRVNAGQRVEQIMLAPGMVVANVLRTKLLAFNMEGKELWKYDLEGWESNGVMDSRGRIYMAGVQGGKVKLRAVDSRGRGIWEFDTGQSAESVSLLALVKGRIYLVTNNGKLLAIDG